MAAVIRVLMVLSVALLSGALLLPLERPVHVEFSLDQPPPMWVFGAFVLLVGVVAGAAAWTGLVRFRRWGRLLAIVASALIVLAAGLLAQSPLMGQVSGLGIALFAAAASAWLCGVALSYHPLVASRFQA